MRFVETHTFTRAIRAAIDDESYRALQIALMLRPEQGAVIKGSGGLRKVRWARAGAGKRGGKRAGRPHGRAGAGLGSARPGGVQVKTAAFQELLTSVRQAGEIRRGASKPSRATTFRVADIKAVRSKLALSQPEFALMIGVSVATLRNWEQGRRTPDGPALALLRVASKNPEVVAAALHGWRGAA